MMKFVIFCCLAVAVFGMPKKENDRDEKFLTLERVCPPIILDFQVDTSKTCTSNTDCNSDRACCTYNSVMRCVKAAYGVGITVG